jgi:uncharacterized protein YcfL
MKDLTFLILVFILVGCGSSKQMPTAEKLSALKSAVENKKIKFVATSANAIGLASVRGIDNLMPAGSNQSNISLTGTSNYFIIDNDTIQMKLPYFGRQDIAKGYNGNDVGFQYDGDFSKYSQSFNQKKGHYTLNFSLDLRNENLYVTLYLYSNNKARLDINSSVRSAIFYAGDWEVAE